MDETLVAELVAQGFELVETHISRVFLAQADVFKTKRPVELGFLDFRSPAQRQRACEAELTLNRRLAPDVYLGLSALVRDARGALGFVPYDQREPRAPLELAVHMRRLRTEARADVRLAAGLLERAEIEQIARCIADFHQRVRRDAETASFGAPERIAENVEENFSQVEALVADHLSAEEMQSIVRYQRAFLAQHAPAFAARVAGGFVRDGHGDLRLEHVYRRDDGSHAIIDCIEFNERFRFADVCADLAFLSMDLRAHGHRDLAELLLAAYAEQSDDYGLYQLVDFYESYRAFVRAKVASFLAHDAHVREQTRRAAHAAARRHFLLALAAARPQLTRPRALVCFGMIASGKSTLAEGLATRLGVGVLCADRVRKQLLAMPLTEQMHVEAFSGAYAPEVSARVYALMRGRAAAMLRSGRSVILDATFAARSERALLQEEVAKLGADVMFLECRCTRAGAMERLERRSQRPSVSDGRAEIYDAVAERFEAPDELPAGAHLVLDTDAPPERALAAAQSAL